MFGLLSLCHKVHNTHIQLQVDNTTAVCYLQNFGGCRSRTCNDLACSIWHWCIEKRLWITSLPPICLGAKYSSKQQNIWWYYGVDVIQVCIWTHFSAWGPFKLDMLTSGLNAQVNGYVSYQPVSSAKHVHAFTMSWTTNYFHAFPPWRCINLCLSNTFVDAAECVMMITICSTQTWWTCESTSRKHYLWKIIW